MLTYSKAIQNEVHFTVSITRDYFFFKFRLGIHFLCAHKKELVHVMHVLTSSDFHLQV
jgi:hypothetical protein